MLAQLGEPADRPGDQGRASTIWSETQEADGSWFGRWGVNYIYGTWSALCALNAAGLSTGRTDGAPRPPTGWSPSRTPTAAGARAATATSSTTTAIGPRRRSASQTAWALLGLMAAGEVDHPAVARGIAWLRRTRTRDGFWAEDAYTGGGFPRVFYLRYHGYREVLPAVGAGPLPQPHPRRQRRASALACDDPGATGLRREARLIAAPTCAS